ncbi:helix-turn-helix transcriptional regulator [Actinosynnema mirum]|uniref:Transcriptional regulator, LuxR family n=1 Tax=Actinosynnema mirum (strain ATCC 29888 / DSM 43827 / JCM 3225 / NBRC 14064 / NCIMB 13271 / NRRL B-12336 / IMRU 3971 / 101) TaxID=446462 RepID=C6WAV6_ACTMD|nr:LuxR family transcriptional regulator [Actinosynnema mirum]ACU37425.1 transcriptional regulator, LuxR family [Actinosynnema mirum DSM 43827]
MITHVVGRAAELAYVTARVQPGSGGALVLLGDAGIGKTTILDQVSEQAREAGTTVFRAHAGEVEQALPYAVLHRLLRPLLHLSDRLPRRQRDALHGAFGLAAADRANSLQTGLAALTLLSTRADSGPLLVVLDDAQWADRASLDVVSFLAQRLVGEPIGLLVAARATIPPAGFQVPVLRLRPLAERDAEALLDRQPDPPGGAVRRALLDAAAGNPLALVTLAGQAPEVAEDTDPVPLADRLERAFTAHLAALPEVTRAALVVAAADDSAVLPGAAEALEPAVAAGLVRVREGSVHFRHSVLRAVVYRGAGFAERRRAHLLLAEAARADPDRRAWHLSAASSDADEAVAAEIAEAARRAARRGANQAALDAWERAADLTPEGERKVARLGEAALTAMSLGRHARARMLAARAGAGSPGPSWASMLEATAVLRRTVHPDQALELAMPIARAAGGDRATLNAVGLVAYAAYAIGEPGLLAGLLEPGEDITRRFASVVAFPFAAAPQVDTDRGQQNEVVFAGALAILRDEYEAAIQLLATAVDQHGSVRSAGLVASTLAKAYWHTGRWADAEAVLAPLVAAHRVSPDVGTIAATTQAAALAAVRGDVAMARRHVADAVDLGAPGVSLDAVVHARFAEGLAATAVGDHAAAFAAYAAVFTEDGEPVHYYLSHYAVADLAGAAVHLGDGGAVRGGAGPVGGGAGTVGAVGAAGGSLGGTAGGAGDDGEGAARAAGSPAAVGGAGVVAGGAETGASTPAAVGGAEAAAGRARSGASSPAGVSGAEAATGDTGSGASTPAPAGGVGAAGGAQSDSGGSGAAAGPDPVAGGGAAGGVAPLVWVAAVLRRTEELTRGDTPPRLRLLIARARLLVGLDPGELPVTTPWPFDHAKLLLDQGEQLRRSAPVAGQDPVDVLERARVALGGALELFERLGARPWVERARTELAATGAQVTPGTRTALSGLSPEQQEIVRLAASGMTTKEIAERVLLSRRAVKFHLYQAFPMLGVTKRSQLREVVGDTPETHTPETDTAETRTPKTQTPDTRTPEAGSRSPETGAADDVVDEVPREAPGA